MAIERTEQCFDIKPAWLAGDTAYGSGANLNWLVNDAKIAPHIPVIDKSRREDGTFSREDFRFDKDRNVYICPAGKVLKTTGTVIIDGETRSSNHAAIVNASRCCSPISSAPWSWPTPWLRREPPRRCYAG